MSKQATNDSNYKFPAIDTGSLPDIECIISLLTQMGPRFGPYISSIPAELATSWATLTKPSGPLDAKYYRLDGNQQDTTSLRQALEYIASNDCHSSCRVNGLPNVYNNMKQCTGDKKVSCDFHNEPLIWHLIICAYIAGFEAVKAQLPHHLVEAVMFTALFHDIGKPASLGSCGKYLNYFGHSVYGNMLLARAYSPEMEKFFSRKMWMAMCRAVGAHMGGCYHASTPSMWDNERRQYARIETPLVKEILQYIGIGDRLGAFYENADEESVQFLRAYEDNRKQIRAGLTPEDIKDLGHDGVIFALVSPSCCGKSTTIDKLREHMPNAVVVSRDIIKCEIIADILKCSEELPENGRAEGPLYHKLHKYYETHNKECKYGDLLNRLMQTKIMQAINAGNPVIIDTCMTMFPLKNIIPTGSNPLIVNIILNRTVPLTEADALKNGITLSDQITLSNFIKKGPLSVQLPRMANPLRIGSRYDTASYDSSKDTVIQPHFSFTITWGDIYTDAIDTFDALRPVFEFSNTLSIILNELKDESLTSYLNRIWKQTPSIEAVSALFALYGFECCQVKATDLLILRFNYPDGCKAWNYKWQRECRGSVYVFDGIWKCIKYSLPRGAEMACNGQIGLSETENQEIANGYITNLGIFDKLQQSMMVQLYQGGSLDPTVLTSKADGSIISVTCATKRFAKQFKHIITSIEPSTTGANEHIIFALSVLQMCEEEGLPPMIFHTNKMLLASGTVLAYIVHSMLVGSGILSEDMLSTEVANGLSPVQVFTKYGKQLLNKFNILVSSMLADFEHSETVNCMSISTEAIVRNRTTVWGDTHYYLATRYGNSTIRIIAGTILQDEIKQFYPHFNMSEAIHRAGFIEPAYWCVDHTDRISELLGGFEAIISMKLTDEQFFELYPPSNTYNYMKDIDPEGFCIYINCLEFSYGKLKTMYYYITHKPHFEQQKCVQTLLEIAHFERFPIAREFTEYYKQFMQMIIVYINRVKDACITHGGEINKGLPPNAPINLPLQKFLRMCSSQSSGFADYINKTFRMIFKTPKRKAASNPLEENQEKNIIKKQQELMCSIIINYAWIDNPMDEINKTNLCGEIYQLFFIK